MAENATIIRKVSNLKVNYDTLDLNTADVWAYEFALTKGANEHSLYATLSKPLSR